MASASIHEDNLGKNLKYLHPNIISNIDSYKRLLLYFPSYHGCRYRNRNRTRKRIYYNKGKQCLVPVHSFCRRPVKKKYLGNHIGVYMIRYRTIFLQKTCNNIFITNLLEYS